MKATIIGAALGARAGSIVRSAERRTVRLGEALGQTRPRAGRLERAHETLGRRIRTTGDATGALAAGHARLGRAIDRTRRRLDGYRGDLRRTGRLERARRGVGRTWAAAGAVAGAARRPMGGARAHGEAAVRLRAVRGNEFPRVRYALNGAGLEASAARVGAAVVSKVAAATRGAPARAAEVGATARDNLGGAPGGGFARRGAGTSTRQGGAAGVALGAVVRHRGPASDQPGPALVRPVGAGGERGRRGPVATREGLDAAPGCFGACAAAHADAVRGAFGGGGKAALVPEHVPGAAPATRERAACATVVLVRIGEAVEGSEELKKSLVAVAQGVVASIVVEAGKKLGPVVKIGRAIGRITGAQWAWNAAVRAGSRGGVLPTTRRGRLGAALRGTLHGAGRVARGAAGGAQAGARAAGRGVARMGGMLKMLGRSAAFALGVVGFKVVAVGALIAGAVYLVHRHWEPITGFFRGLWGRVTAVFKPVVEAWGKVFTDFSWAAVGSAVMETLALGIRTAAGAPVAALTTVLGKVRGYLPFSDARTGPLSALTASGGALLRTVGDGVRRAGPDGLRRPLARELAAASTVLALAPPALGAAVPVPLLADPPPAAPAMPAAPAPVPWPAALVSGLGAAAPAPPAAPAPAPRPAASVADNRRIYVTIQQQPREDAAALVDRLLAEIERRDGVRRRAALHDEV